MPKRRGGDGHDSTAIDMAINSCLATILAREACLRKGRMTMEELLKANRPVEVSLDGLKA